MLPWISKFDYVVCVLACVLYFATTLFIIIQKLDFLDNGTYLSKTHFNFYWTIFTFLRTLNVIEFNKLSNNFRHSKSLSIFLKKTIPQFSLKKVDTCASTAAGSSCAVWVSHSYFKYTFCNKSWDVDRCFLFQFSMFGKV